MDHEHFTFEAPACHKYVCSQSWLFLPGRILTKCLPVVYSNPSLAASRLVAACESNGKSAFAYALNVAEQA